MFHGLERSDRTAKGHTVKRVVTAHFQRAIRTAHLFERHQHCGKIEHAGENAPPFGGCAQRFCLGAVKGDLSLAVRLIQIGQRFARYAITIQFDNEQADVGFPAGRAGTCGDNRKIGNCAVGHRRLDA